MTREMVDSGDESRQDSQRPSDDSTTVAGCTGHPATGWKPLTYPQRPDFGQSVMGILMFEGESADEGLSSGIHFSLRFRVACSDEG